MAQPGTTWSIGVREDGVAEPAHHHQLVERQVPGVDGAGCPLGADTVGHAAAHATRPPEIGQGTALLRHPVAPPRPGLRRGHQLWQVAVERQAEFLGLLRLGPFSSKLPAQPGLVNLGNQVVDG